MWLFPQHSSNIDPFFETLQIFSDLNGIKKDGSIQQNFLKIMIERGMYSPNTIQSYGFDTSTANHKIDEVRFYGGLYETSGRKIHISSYGELLLKYRKDELKRNKIFLSMIFNIQYPNPYKRIKDVNIYPVRLIIQCALDNQLDKKISNIEIALILYNIDKIETKQEYEKIVNKILEFREKSDEDKLIILESNAEWFIKNYVNCNYFMNILENMHISNNNERTPLGMVKSSDRKDSTKISKKEISINKNMYEFIQKSLEIHTIYDVVKTNETLKDDWIRNIYNDLDESLLLEIGEQTKIIDYMEIPEMLLYTATHSDRWDEFEEYITRTFDMFDDVIAHRISGPSEPDMLASYNYGETVFVADAKSRGKTLFEINDGRLSQHREKYKAKYTLVITPKYRPSALTDIRGRNTCIITSYCLVDLITKYIFKAYKDRKECSYRAINEMILNNLGKDVSANIYSLIDENYGVSIKELKFNCNID
ncbi:MAG: hypothetical protein PHD15_06260 [Clostridia bacterium]|nr:hypothetical protein [Clostridia bacterium]MDD4387333.1 hypothetical protein [Clostridia bacterium]